MARDNTQPVYGKFVVLSAYLVDRLAPYAQVFFAECNYVMDGPYTVGTVTGTGASTAITVDALADDETLVGRRLALADSTDVGSVATSVKTQLTAAVTDGNGNVTAPATYTRTITLSTAPTQPLAGGTSVGIATLNAIGQTAYRAVPGGRQWNLRVDTTNPSALARLETMMGSIMGNAAGAVMQALGVSQTPQAIATAVQTLAAQSVNVDSLFADQGEALDADRLAGTVPWVVVSGTAPTGAV